MPSYTHDSAEKTITNLLPKKDPPIVVYCWSVRCPMAGYMLDRLVKMGYNKLYRPLKASLLDRGNGTVLIRSISKSRNRSRGSIRARVRMLLLISSVFRVLVYVCEN